MGYSRNDLRCKKHPKHKQSTGVCPSCLKDRLARLYSSSSSSSVTTVSSSESTPYSSESSYSSSTCSSSYESSPVHYSLSWKRDEMKEGRKRGFWSKLLMGSGSKSMKGKMRIEASNGTQILAS